MSQIVSCAKCWWKQILNILTYIFHLCYKYELLINTLINHYMDYKPLSVWNNQIFVKSMEREHSQLLASRLVTNMALLKKKREKRHSGAAIYFAFNMFNPILKESTI